MTKAKLCVMSGIKLLIWLVASPFPAVLNICRIQVLLAEELINLTEDCLEGRFDSMHYCL